MAFALAGDALSTSGSTSGTAALLYQYFTSVGSSPVPEPSSGNKDSPKGCCPRSAGDRKKKQTIFLVASLISAFHRTHGDSPQTNPREFFFICQVLRTLLGPKANADTIISHLLRASPQQPLNDEGFQRLLLTAIEIAHDQDLFLHHQRLIRRMSDDDSLGWQVGEQEVPASYRAKQQQHQRLSTSSSETQDLLCNLSVQNSRYQNDFVEMGMLGRGGFASVWRARNKLDGIDYAIKKIRLGHRSSSSSSTIFREIKHLARLEHRNVVRYYASWIEVMATERRWKEEGSRIGFDEDAIDSSTSTSSTHNPPSIFGGHDPTFLDDDAVPYHANDSSSDIAFDPSTSIPDSSAISPPLEECMLYIQMQLCPTTLHDYIQVRNIQQGRGVDPDRNIEIFSQILEGTAYIHEQGVIHRDLKPTNIFLSMPASFIERKNRRGRSRASSRASATSSSIHSHHHGSPLESGFIAAATTTTTNAGTPSTFRGDWDEPWVPKIGDFGLAAATLPSNEEIEGQQRDDSSSILVHYSAKQPLEASFHPQPRMTHTSEIGTRTYASPEQLAKKPSAYDEKVDIYSLGIIFFEMYKPFSTAMERAEAIESLKHHGTFPEGFVECYPKESALILWMMDANPAHRPTAPQLLESELFTAEEQSMDAFAVLQSQLIAKSMALDKKSEEVAALRHRMEHIEREKQIEAEAMQKRLDDLQQQLEHARFQRSSPPTADFRQKHPALKSP